jgi:hypothetical protein
MSQDGLKQGEYSTELKLGGGAPGIGRESASAVAQDLGIRRKSGYMCG